ncbi:MAG: hypothetical protein ACC657_03845 [Thiohalomonadales bacterium]
MNYVRPNINRFIVLLLLILFIGACTPLIGAYSPTAYSNATSLKVESLALMDKATEPYSKHTDKVEELVIDLNKAYEYVNGLPRNSISAQQWKILIDTGSDGKLIGKFIKRWEEAGTKNQTFIDNFKGLVSDAFDEIICLEVNKKEATACFKK